MRTQLLGQHGDGLDVEGGVHRFTVGDQGPDHDLQTGDVSGRQHAQPRVAGPGTDPVHRGSGRGMQGRGRQFHTLRRAGGTRGGHHQRGVLPCRHTVVQGGDTVRGEHGRRTHRGQQFCDPSVGGARGDRHQGRAPTVQCLGQQPGDPFPRHVQHGLERTPLRGGEGLEGLDDVHASHGRQGMPATRTQEHRRFRPGAYRGVSIRLAECIKWALGRIRPVRVLVPPFRSPRKEKQ